MKTLQPLIASLSSEAIQTLMKTKTIELGGFQLGLEDFLIDRLEKEGQVVGSEDGFTVALDTALTPELLREGDARELVNRIQNLRKEAGFRVEDRILLSVQGEGMEAVLQRHGEMIAAEVLGQPLDRLEGAEIEKDVDINGTSVRLALRRRQA
jgi:isoleucyl-tRNA synthetase